MIVGALRLPLVIEGMIEESTTRSRLDADHPGFGIDDREGSAGDPILQLQDGW